MRIALALLLLAVTGQAQVARVVTNGLVGYWPEWTTDRVSSNTLTTFGGLTNVGGKLGGCFNFVKTSQQGAYRTGIGPGNPLDIAGDFTLSAWVYHATEVAGAGDTRCIMERGVYGDVEEYGILISGTPGVGVSLQSNSSYFYANRSVPVGRWVLITATLKGGAGSIYYDGVLVNTGALTPPVSGTNLLGIGYRSGGTYYFNGKLDDVRIYNRALSAQEIASIANSRRRNYSQ